MYFINLFINLHHNRIILTLMRQGKMPSIMLRKVQFIDEIFQPISKMFAINKPKEGMFCKGVF